MIAWLIEALIASTMLMVAVLLLRGPVRRLFGADVAYALWALPVLRLALPPLPGRWSLDGLVTRLVDRSAGEGIAMGVLNPAVVPPSIASHSIAHIDLMIADTPVRAIVVPPIHAAAGPNWLMLALAAWGFGTVLFIVYQLIRYRRFCRRIDGLARRRHRIAGNRVEVIETDATSGPLAFGIWRKVVAFPSDFEERYDADERNLALAHELTHHARGDLIANWIALVTLGLHWFNPIAWRAFRAFRADQEMACDARVLAGRDPAFRHAYGRAIVKAAHGGAISAACHLHTINDLKGRLRMLSQGKKSPARVAGGVASVAALALTGLGLTASGTQAAERLGAKAARTIEQATAVSPIAAIPPIAPITPALPVSRVAPATPIAPIAHAAPQTVPVPPSAVAPAAPIAPVPPSADRAAPEPPAPPAPPAAIFAGDGHVVVWTDADGNTHKKRATVVLRRKDGSLLSGDLLKGDFLKRDFLKRGFVMAEIPQISSADCPADGKEHRSVINENKDGKHTIIICTNRIREVARAAESRAGNAREIERDAYRRALGGLRSARAKMAASGNQEGLKAIDEAIAEIEADLARVG